MEHVITDQTFEADVLKSHVPVLVDFWAPWCGPCKVIGPIVEEVAQEMADKPVKVAKMNVDENPETPGQLSILSIPTLIIFKGGQAVEQMVGVQSKEKLLERLQAHM